MFTLVPYSFEFSPNKTQPTSIEQANVKKDFYVYNCPPYSTCSITLANLIYRLLYNITTDHSETSIETSSSALII